MEKRETEYYDMKINLRKKIRNDTLMIKIKFISLKASLFSLYGVASGVRERLIMAHVSMPI